MVKTRFAPSPTGMLHIGGIRTALFSWLYAKKHNGQFILRIEDTDRERSTDEAVQVILDGMEWLGLQADEGPFYQTRRFDRYEEVIQQLLNEGNAYYCYCSKEEVDAMREEAMAKGEKPRYNGYWRDRKESPPEGVKPVVRFKTPLLGEVVIDDQIQGKVVFNNQELDDLIIARSDGTPTYNLSVVVDDMDMEITHVIRGDDHLNNTPRQINILKALAADLPTYAHVPMILGPDGKKLSKRHGTVSVLQYREEGFLPEALLNYLVRLGWSHGDQEIFSMNEMIELFDISDVNKSASAINPEKLLWLNQQYLAGSDNESLARTIKPMMDYDIENGPDLKALVEVQKHRAKTLVEIAEQSRSFYVDFDEFNEKAGKKHLRPVVLEPLMKLKEQLSGLDEWLDEPIYSSIQAVADEFELKIGKLGQPLRVALTGSGISPSIDATVRLMGKEKTLARMDKALEYIKGRLGK